MKRKAKKSVELARVKKVLGEKNPKAIKSKSVGGTAFHNLSRKRQVEKLKEVKTAQTKKRQLAKAKFKRKARTPR